MLVMAALWLGIVLVPLCLVFVIDTASWWTHHRHLQLQADAAAFAGGAAFAACVADAGGADSAMQVEAATYAWTATSTYNGQIGGANQGSITALFNSPTYASGSGSDDTVTGSSCNSNMFDVKMTEENLPLFFDSVIPGLSVVPAINAHARVNLYEAQSGRPGLPVAVADVAPQQVFVSLWTCGNSDCTSGSSIGTYSSGGPPVQSGSLNMWTISAPGVGIPINQSIGLRVGIASDGGSHDCYPGTASDGGAQYQCYERDSNTPLTIIRGGDTAAVNNTAILHEVEESTDCSGAPFFSDYWGQSSCTATVRAHVYYVVSPPAPQINASSLTVRANGASMTPDQGSCALDSGCWYTRTFTYGMADGQQTVELSWRRSGGGGGPPVFTTFVNGPHQQAYSADSALDVTGPVKIVAVSPGYTFEGGSSQSLTVTVGIQAGLSSLGLPSSSPVALRLTKARGNDEDATSQVLNCDSGQSLAQEIQNGCTTPYAISPTGTCPSSADPADCAPIGGGGGANLRNALRQRIPCSSAIDLSPDPLAQPLDPRLAQLVVTDLFSLSGANLTGGGSVPVADLATFYITGWGRYKKHGGWTTDCNGVNEDPPAWLATVSDNNVTMVWGRFIKWVWPGDVSPDRPTCDLYSSDITPCTAQLVR